MSRDEYLLEFSEYPNDDTDDDNDWRGSDDDDEDTHEHGMNERESLHDDDGEHTYSRPGGTPSMEEFYVDNKYLDDDDRYNHYNDSDDPPRPAPRENSPPRTSLVSARNNQ